MSNNPKATLPTWSRGRRDVVCLAAALAVAACTGRVSTATAARGWCRSDPLVLIADELAYVVFSAPHAIRQSVTGPTEIVVTVPLGVDTTLVAVGPSFGKGETVRFEQSSNLKTTSEGIEVKVAAMVPASEALPISVEFARRARAGHKNRGLVEGVANQWIELSGSIR